MFLPLPVSHSVHRGGMHTPQTHYEIWSVNAWAVHIPLECILVFSFFYCSCFILIAVLNGSMTVSTLGSPKSISNLIFPFSSELTNAFYIMYFDCRRMVNVRSDGSLEVMVTVQCGRRDGDVRWVVYRN